MAIALEAHAALLLQLAACKHAQLVPAVRSRRARLLLDLHVFLKVQLLQLQELLLDFDVVELTLPNRIGYLRMLILKLAYQLVDSFPLL